MALDCTQCARYYVDRWNLRSAALDETRASYTELCMSWRAINGLYPCYEKPPNTALRWQDRRVHLADAAIDALAARVAALATAALTTAALDSAAAYFTALCAFTVEPGAIAATASALAALPAVAAANPADQPRDASPRDPIPRDQSGQHDARV